MKKSKTNILRIIKRKRFFLKTISLTLVFTLIFTSLPMDGIIALAEQAIEESKLITVVEELEQYRTEFSKTYLKSDGTLEAVVSANPIHYEQDGEWVEIDSTLEITENDDGKEVYQNKKGKFKVNLPTQLESGAEVEIEKGENKISIKLLENKKSKGKKNNDKKQKAEKLTKEQRKRMTAGELFEADNNQSSAVEYTSAYNDTNIRYDVTPNEVKESIVLQKAPNKKATYSYEITADGLTAILNEDNSIDFFEGSKMDGAEPVFSMPAPHMFDSNDEYSYEIVTTLENEKGKYILTYKPSYEWLKSKDRAYPVTIDPTVTINSGIQDSYTFSGEGYGDSYTGYEQQLKVGTTAWIAPNDYWQTYLKFTDLPQIPYEDYRIDSAYLMLTPKATTGGWQEMELGVYELTEDWKNHQTGKVAERITFNNAPADVGYSTATATVSRGGADNGVGVGFEIAHLMEKWYENPEENFGIKLAAHLEASQWNDNLVFHSSRSTTGTAPYLSLTYTEYVPVTGIEIVGKQDRLEYLSSFNAFEVSATVYPENATNKEVIWESTNEAAAYYNDGIICAYGIGTTTITAKSADNNEIIDSFDLEVYNIPIETIAITNLPENDTLETGTLHQLSIEAGPDNASDKYYVESDNGAINWSSSNTDVAYFTYNGMLNTGCYGTTTITASYGNVTDSFTLTVTGVQTEEVYPFIPPMYDPMYIGETWSFIGEIEPYNATDKRTICTSSNPDVVGVYSLETSYCYKTEHFLTAISEGTTTIRLEAYNDSTVFYEFTVSVSTFDEELGLNLPYNNTLTKGDTWQITTNPNNTIVIGDSSVISNAGNGYITALKPGTTTIEISTRSGTEYFVHREITVIETCDLEITGIPEVLYVGQTYEELSAIKTPNVGGDVVWSSSDDTIAEVYYDYVRARVVLIGKSQGTVTIYAEAPGALACDEFEIQVEKLKVTGVGIDTSKDLSDGEMYIGEEARLKLDIYPKEPVMASFETVSWNINPEGAVQINYNSKYQYKLSAVASGEVDVQAIVDDVASAILPITVKTPTVQFVNTPSNGMMYIGDSFTLKTDTDPLGLEVTYTCKNSNLVSKNGDIVTAKAIGNIQITAHMSYRGITYTETLNINIQKAEVLISGADDDDKEILEVGKTKQLTARVVAGENVSQEVEWVTDDKEGKIATVDQNGLVTAIAPGEVIISAKSKKYDYAIDTAYFEVVPKASKIIIENPPTNALEVNKEYSLKVSVEPSNTIDKEVVFSSNNADIYINPNTGKISVLGAGKAVITVKLKSDSSISATCHIEGMYSYGFSVQNAYPFFNCEMHTLGFNGNYESFDNYANKVNSQFTNFMIKKFDYRGENSFAFDLKNKKYFGTVVDRPNIDDVDLMIYTGHGYAKNRDKSEGLFQYNSIHYGHHGTPGNVISHNLGKGTNAEDNFTTKDAMHFGQGTKSKWLLTYTCNFLNTKQGDPYVNSLLNNGGRLIMGMGTKSYVVPDEGTMFSNLLTQGKTFKHAFCEAGKRYQNLGSDPEKNNRSAKKYRIAYYGPYGKGTLNDTIIGSLSAIEKTETKIFEQIINKYDFNEFEEY